MNVSIWLKRSNVSEIRNPGIPTLARWLCCWWLLPYAFRSSDGEPCAFYPISSKVFCSHWKGQRLLAHSLPSALRSGDNDLTMFGQLICQFHTNVYGCIVYSSTMIVWPKITSGTGSSFVLYLLFLILSLRTMGSLISLKNPEGWTLPD